MGVLQALQDSAHLESVAERQQLDDAQKDRMIEMEVRLTAASEREAELVMKNRVMEQQMHEQEKA